MRKSDIVERLKSKTGLTLQKSNEVLNAFLETITFAISHGEDVIIKGFGRFERRKCNARNFRNPSTGEIVPKGEHYKPWFKSSKLLRARVNRKD